MHLLINIYAYAHILLQYVIILSNSSYDNITGLQIMVTGLPLSRFYLCIYACVCACMKVCVCVRASVPVRHWHSHRQRIQSTVSATEGYHSRPESSRLQTHSRSSWGYLEYNMHTQYCIRQACTHTRTHAHTHTLLYKTH